MTKQSIADQVAAFHARGGQVTLCPDRKCAPTQASIPHPFSTAGKQDAQYREFVNGPVS